MLHKSIFSVDPYFKKTNTWTKQNINRKTNVCELCSENSDTKSYSVWIICVNKISYDQMFCKGSPREQIRRRLITRSDRRRCKIGYSVAPASLALLSDVLLPPAFEKKACAAQLLRTQLWFSKPLLSNCTPSSWKIDPSLQDSWKYRSGEEIDVHAFNFPATTLIWKNKRV